MCLRVFLTVYQLEAQLLGVRGLQQNKAVEMVGYLMSTSNFPLCICAVSSPRCIHSFRNVIHAHVLVFSIMSDETRAVSKFVHTINSQFSQILIYCKFCCHRILNQHFCSCIWCKCLVLSDLLGNFILPLCCNFYSHVVIVKLEHV